MVDESKKGKKESFVVLEIEGISITKDAMNWNVESKKKSTHHISLASSLSEVSNRLFIEKLKKRNNKEIKDLASLVELINEHDKWFRDLTKGM